MIGNMYYGRQYVHYIRQYVLLWLAICFMTDNI